MSAIGRMTMRGIGRLPSRADGTRPRTMPRRRRSFIHCKGQEHLKWNRRARVSQQLNRTLPVENDLQRNFGRHGPKMIQYRTGNNLDLDGVIELYRSSTLGERRPIADRDRMGAMLRNANLVVTAWDGELLVGISRALTDFVYATYLSDLAVRLSHQRRGIGRELMRQTRAEAPDARIILLSAPAAESYYPHVGFTHHPQAWVLPVENPFR